MNKGDLPSVYLDPSYEVFYEDRLFDMSNPVLNRDGHLLAFGRLHDSLNKRGIKIHTADYLFKSKSTGEQCNYYSLGLLGRYQQLVDQSDVRLRAFIIMEPPVVAPKLYRALPDLSTQFERIYLHNILGDGYSLQGVDKSKLRKLYWPQPYNRVLEPFWSQSNRLRRIVVINSSHIPRSWRNELYSVRIKAMASMAKFGFVDLYGHGWDKWWSHRSMWPPYWRNYKSLMSIYRGPCKSKYETLSQYVFCLCFENMAMSGYITEKLFDCLYAGTIPIYLGATDIDDLIPPNVYVDSRNFQSWDELYDRVMKMSDEEITTMRRAGRVFVESDNGRKYFDSLINIIND